jgi:hypothetical protein
MVIIVRNVYSSFADTIRERIKRLLVLVLAITYTLFYLS